MKEDFVSLYGLFPENGSCETKESIRMTGADFAVAVAKGIFTQYDLIFLSLDREDEYKGTVETLPAGRCLTARFCGSHADAPIYYKRLMDSIVGAELTIRGFSREITMIDYGLTNDTSRFVTEIRIPIE